MEIRWRGMGITLCIVLLFVLGAPLSAREPEVRVLVFAPTTEDNTYWPQVFEILRAAAEDLDVELLTYEFPVADRYAKHTEGVRILESVPDVDGAILSVAFGQTRPLLQTAARRDIPVFIQGPLFESELPELGYEPRRTFDNWIGLFEQDEFEKGRILGDLLLERAAESGAPGAAGNIQVVGIGGDPTWYGSELRANGLRAAVRNTSGCRLMQVVPTQWSEADGRRVAAGLLDRYPEATVVWAASDQLAIGAVRAAEERGRTVGQDVFIGGLDLSVRGLEFVEEGRLTATVASSLLSYAEILVYLYDYIHGEDFAEAVGTDIRLEAETATGHTADQYRLLYDSVEAIDFSIFSRAFGADWNGYDFSLDGYLEALDR